MHRTKNSTFNMASSITTKCNNKLDDSMTDLLKLACNSIDILEAFDQVKIYGKYLVESNIDKVLKRFNPVKKCKTTACTKRGLSRKRFTYFTSTM